MEDVPEDCTRCGACCFSESPRHARVTGDDYERLGEAAPRLVTFLDDNRAYMRLSALEGESACAALVFEDGRFVCSEYVRRPQVCRDLERGSPACGGELSNKRQRALRVITRRS